MNLRLLLNENFPVPALQPLRGAGLDVLAVSESFRGMLDPELLVLAVAEHRWPITFDRDYGELIFARNPLAPPAVRLLGGASYQPEEPADWILRILQDHLDCLGKFVFFYGQTSRSRPLLWRVDHGPE